VLVVSGIGVVLETWLITTVLVLGPGFVGIASSMVGVVLETSVLIVVAPISAEVVASVGAGAALDISVFAFNPSGAVLLVGISLGSGLWPFGGQPFDCGPFPAWGHPL